MKKILLLIISVLCCCCKNDIKIVKGDLYFKLVNFTPPSGMSDEQAYKIEKMLDSVEYSTNSKESEILINYFKMLKTHKLLKNPYIKLKVNKNNIKTIFLSNDEYQKLKKYSLDYLKKNKMRIEVELKIKELDSNIYYSDKIINLNEIKGDTFFEK